MLSNLLYIYFLHFESILYTYMTYACYIISYNCKQIPNSKTISLIVVLECFAKKLIFYHFGCMYFAEFETDATTMTH